MRLFPAIQETGRRKRDGQTPQLGETKQSKYGVCTHGRLGYGSTKGCTVETEGSCGFQTRTTQASRVWGKYVVCGVLEKERIRGLIFHTSYQFFLRFCLTRFYRCVVAFNMIPLIDSKAAHCKTPGGPILTWSMTRYMAIN